MVNWDVMSRACSICTHPARVGIEEATVGGVPYRRIARTYGVSISAICRHLKSHMMTEELLAMLRARAAALKERELSASLGPEIVEWMRAEEAALEDLVNLIEEGDGVAPLELFEYTMEGDEA